LIPSIELPAYLGAATEAGLTTLLTAVTAVDGSPNALLSAGAIHILRTTTKLFAACSSSI